MTVTADERFVPGQRWYSSAEPELGLGTVLRVQARNVQIVFDGADTLRQYAMHSAPLLRAAFRIGERICVEGREWRVDAIDDIEGLLRYTCGDHTFVEGQLDAGQPVSQADSRLLSGRIDRSGRFDFRVELLTRRAKARSHPGWGILGARIDLIAHQLRVAALADERNPVRLLLADEVGLGKTIEACLITARLIATERVGRVLVLVPESLVHQWFIELLRRFNLRFSIYDEERCEAIVDANPAANPFEDSQWLIASSHWLAGNPKRRTQLLAAGWDLVLIDEAHHLEWHPDDVSVQYQLAEQLAASAAHLLLLSATPEQLGMAGHFARLRLLDPPRYPDLDAFLAQVEHYQELSQIVERLDQGTAVTEAQRTALQRVFVDDADTLAQHLVGVAAGESTAREALIADLIDRHGTGQVMLRNRRVAVGGFPKRIGHLDRLPPSEDPTHSGTLLAEFLADAGDADNAEHHCEPQHDYLRDPRLDWLLAVLECIAPGKALLLCHSRAKVQALEEALRLRSGITVARFHEDMSLLQRDRNAAWFADPDGAPLLIASEVGAEGRNFQFAQHLILWDLPIDPDQLEQRIGRLDRIGQRGDVNIHANAIIGSAQDMLLRWYDEGLNAFTSVVADGRSLLRQFRTELLALAHDPSPTAVDDLIARSRRVHGELAERIAQGRDRLLELASQRGDDDLRDALRDADDEDAHDDFPLRLLEQLGVQHEDIGAGLFTLDPEYLAVDGLDELKEGPSQVCLSRELALARDDLLYLRADHPLVMAAGDLVLASDAGNAAFVVDELPARSAILEAVFVLECVAAPGLDAERYLPALPIRVAVDTRLQSRPDFRLSPRAQQRAAERDYDIGGQRRLLGKLLPPMLEAAREIAEAQVSGCIASAVQQARSALDARIERLRALAKHNPAIDPAQITRLEASREQLANTLAQARPRLDALRLVGSPDFVSLRG
jgi:ATP-dependent helicase HepA